MRDSFLTKGIDGVTVLLGTALILNGLVEFAVLSENFDQFGG
jgi:putative Mn2+ efflux pump MntP